MEVFLVLFVLNIMTIKGGQLVSQRNAKRVTTNITLIHETKKSLFNVSL